MSLSEFFSRIAVFNKVDDTPILVDKKIIYEEDELDKRLLEAFSNLFPRPKSIYFCEFDIAESAMLELCNNSHIAFEDASLIKTFVWHCTLGMFGDWTKFPAFAGDIAVVARRECFDFENDLVFWYFHTSKYGMFPTSIYPLLLEWVSDILKPWECNIKRSWPTIWEIHYIGYLAILVNVGGDPERIIVEHLKFSKKQNFPTHFLEAINEEFIDNEKEIFEHFRQFRRSFIQQETPPPKVRRVISVENIQRIVNAIKSHKIEIQSICRSEVNWSLRYLDSNLF